ncbi:MAG: inorganic phosphate transporter [Pseudomonadota bacterium]|jgi:PiT family inorganic phosphate transporter|nr:inorganic phosphate transporter [Pseudomonadota bacterium]
MPDLALLIVMIALAIAFDFINGFHDTANAIATAVATRVLSPGQAILMAAVMNFLGAITGTAVAKTVGAGLIDPSKATTLAVVATLVAAITWNLLTWYRGIPSSSSHALIGGILGASIAQSGLDAPHWLAVLEKVVLPLILSPIIGFIFAALILIVVLRTFGTSHPRRISLVFGRLQLLSSALMAYSHGGNDAQKTMGIITLGLVAYGMQSSFDVPLWVILVAATAMALGTAAGGWRIIRTIGTRLGKLKPVDGFAAETSAAIVIGTASQLGFPLSTTHVISSSILGVGVTRQPANVHWVVAGNIITAWIITIPICALLAYLCYFPLALAAR